ncbi:MAG: UTP--glucose-1-phosphate uridylyltransferase [Deltaproteobacteria bacterium]|nr:UTP--glucose-1-phosphate uridylyltransferase [Deltaproteobacteria bacterium]
MIDKQQALAHLTAHGQQHVLRFFDTLSATAQRSLLMQIEALDLAWLKTALTTPASTGTENITPYDAVIRAEDPATQEALRRGEEALERGEVGVLLVAGGAGSRLGFEGPKGLYPLGAVSKRTLFQIHIDRLRAVGRRYGVIPALFVMTSPDNHEETRRYLAENDNFGLPAERLMIFPQGVAPAVDFEGQLLLADKHTLILSPNGNGGLFAAMHDSGAFTRMQSLGVTSISYIQVDNALADPADACFIGHHLRVRSEFSCKAMPKRGPLEKVGNIARVGERLGIVEYYEVPDELVSQRDATGELLFNFGNPGLFLWSVAFAERQAARLDLPIHRARKKLTCVDQEGQLSLPQEPNGLKLETFALDTLADAERTLVYACERDVEFAPVKNGEGEDSPASAQALMTDLFRGWVQAAGGQVEQDCQLEVNPLYALDAQELAVRLPKGLKIAKDTYLTEV